MIQRFTFGVLKPDRDDERGEYVKVSDLCSALRDIKEEHERTLMRYVHFNADQSEMNKIEGAISAVNGILDGLNGVKGA